MKKGLHQSLFVIVMLLFFASGTICCSGLGRQDYLQASIAGTGWVPLVEGAVASYKFELEGVTIVLCPELRGTWVISFGPVLLPVIPIFIGPPKISTPSKFWMRVGIESPFNTSTIDLAKIRIELPAGKVLPVSEVSAFKTWGEYPGSCEKFVTRDNERKLDIGLFVVSGERISLMVKFNVFSEETERFTLHLGDLSVDGRDIKLPALEYIKASKYRYIPFYIPQPS